MLDRSKDFNNIKIVDFGISMRYKPYQEQDEHIGTPHYIAPEVLEGNYTSQCDIWSVGVILYNLLVGEAPFNGDTDNDVYEAIKLGKYTIP